MPRDGTTIDRQTSDSVTPSVLLLIGDAVKRLKGLADGSVHACVTSPPYFNLRNYDTEPTVWGGDPDCTHQWIDGRKVVSNTPISDKSTLLGNGHIGASPKQKTTYGALTTGAVCTLCGADRGCLGSEETPRVYIEHLVTVFDEVRRVLRDDGSLWIVIGDGFNNRAKIRNSSHQPALNKFNDDDWATRAASGGCRMSILSDGLKEKDLLGIPWMLAFALRDAGWYLREEVVWQKPSCMPESVLDRCTRQHETVLHLTKSPKYFHDWFAIAEEAVKPFQRMQASPEAQKAKSLGPMARGEGINHQFRNSGRLWGDSMRNMRSIWTINPEPLMDSHYAAFPTRLASRAIQASTSEHGACGACGAPWRRVVEKGDPDEVHRAACGADAAGGYEGQSQKDYASAGAQDASATKARILAGMTVKRTVGWEPGCRCDPFVVGGVVPCVVLDCFSGAGTTALSAVRLGRDAIGVELNEGYVWDIALKRLEDVKAKCLNSAGERLAWRECQMEIG